MRRLTSSLAQPDLLTVLGAGSYQLFMEDKKFYPTVGVNVHLLLMSPPLCFYIPVDCPVYCDTDRRC